MCWRVLVHHHLLSYDFVNLMLSDTTDIELCPNQNSNVKCFTDEKKVLRLIFCSKNDSN